MGRTDDITGARRALGEQLAQFRTAAGLSQPQLAPLIGYSRSTIATAETGQRAAARDFWQRCDQVLNTSGALTGQYDELAALRRQHRQTVQHAAQAERLARILGWHQVVGDAGSMIPLADGEMEPITAALDKPWRVSHPALGAVASVLAATRVLEDETSSRAVLPTVHNLVGIIDVYARDAPSQVRARTLALASELHYYLGWLWLDGGHPQRQTEAVFDSAMSLAVEADNPDHLAQAASFKGYMALKTGRFDQAVTLSEIAGRDRRTLAALRVFDGYQAGLAHALAGDIHSAEQAMLAADRQLEALPDDPLPDWGYWYHVPFLVTQRASVHEALNRTDRAIADLETGLTEMPPEHRNAEWGREIQERLAALRVA